jgi:xanthine dehydrogenase accessory factor
MASLMDEFLTRAHELTMRGIPFALATVVRVDRPASARPGMKAIILADGTLEGWVGGSCAHPVVVREALRLLGEGTAALIGLNPPGQAGPERPGVVYYPMTCHSGGSLEIYVEPVLPQPRLLVVGEAPVVDALAALGRLQGFAVAVAAAGTPARPAEAVTRLPLDEIPRRVTSQTYAVIATMGGYDEEALERVLQAEAAYVALVASRKRAEAIFAYLRDRGIPHERLQHVKVPAGLDIGAVTPAEIALSIMAEIVQVRRSRPAAAPEAPARPEAPTREEAIDPVCGMTVLVATARHIIDYQGRRFYFCSAHCRQTFEQEPARYATAPA